MPRRRYTEQQFRDALADPEVRTMADLCRAVGLVPRGANYETLRRFAATLGVAETGPLARRTRRQQPPAPHVERALVEALTRNVTIAAALREIGRPVSSDSYRWVREVVARLDLDTDHLLGRGWARARQRPELRKPLTPILEAGTHVKSSRLRQRLVITGLKEHRCEGCSRATWCGEAIPLELDHIDGDRQNNELHNLRLLCPNCHARTPTYRGRNIGRFPRKTDQRRTGP